MTITSVPLLDPCRANSAVEDRLRGAFEQVLHSGRFILGDQVEGFERECAEYLGVEHAIGVSSGTDALLVALMALDIGPGDEVICPTFTFFATAGSIWRTGAKPVFVDSRTQHLDLDPNDVRAKISTKTRAIMPVHLFGQCAEMDALRELAVKHDLAIIEDAAQAIGAEYRGVRAGGLGTVGCFSFFPSKNVGGFGDSGLCTTRDAWLADRIRALRSHGSRQMYEHPDVGGNFRIDALQAALLRVKLRYADDYAAGRQKHAELYTRLFCEAGIGTTEHTPKAASGHTGADAPLVLPSTGHSRHVFNQYVIRVRGAGRRDRLHKALQAQNIGCAVYYPKPLHLQPCFSSLGHKAGDFPVAESLAGEVLALPVFSELIEGEISYVTDAVIRFFREEGAGS
jgi:dTDP-4-amino-4,6-dideoxygalactose transaminase